MSTPGTYAALRGALAATRSRRWRLWASVGLGALAIAASIGLLTTSGYLISRAAQRPNSILVLSAAIVGVRFFGITRAIARYAERLVSHDLAFRVLADTRLRVFTSLVPLVPADAQGLRRGDLLSRFVGDVDALQDLYLRGLAPPMVAAVTSVMAVGVAAIMLPVAALVLAGGLLIGIMLVPLLTAASTRAAARRQGPARAVLTGQLVEIVRGAGELAVAGRAGDWAARAAAADRDLAHAQTRDALAGGLAAGLGIALTGTTAACVALVCAPAVQSGRLSPVLVAALILLSLAAFEGVITLGDAARGVLRSAHAAERIAEITDRPPSVIDPADPLPIPPTGDLVLEGVRRRHEPDGPWILDGVDLRLTPGQAVALVGRSGIGKSTLADLLVRFADPHEGRITLGGADLRDVAQEDVRRVVRLAGQGAHLFATTIRQNVLLARPGAAEADVIAALEHVGLADWLAGLPDGLDTFVGEHGAQVSGGQRGRIAAARGVLTDARFRVFDEPAAHLDPDGAQALLRALATVAHDQGAGVFVITHGTDGLDAFDTVLALQNGRLRTIARGE